MNKQTFNGFGSYRHAELELDETQIRGAGGSAHYPRLIFPARIILYSSEDGCVDWHFTLVTAQLNNEGKIADSLPIPLDGVCIGGLPHPQQKHVNLEFPLDFRRLEVLEQIRNGGDIRLELQVELSADEWGFVSELPVDSGRDIWRLRNFHRGIIQTTLNVPRSTWIERVLPQIGYGTIHVVEFPATPLEACAALSHSYNALRQAQEHHKLGLYDDAVGKCRVALDQFFEYVEADAKDGSKRNVPVVKKSWETKVGQATYEWLNQSLGALKTASNRPHHSPNIHYDQLESQMLLAITAALVSYAARSYDPKAGL